MSETKHTPGPWEIKTVNYGRSTSIKAGLVSVASVSVTNIAADANARLIAAAPDHAIVARGLAAGELRWEPATRELCFQGLRHSTELDEFGVPRLTDHLRALIAKAERHPNCSCGTGARGACIVHSPRE